MAAAPPRERCTAAAALSWDTLEWNLQASVARRTGDRVICPAWWAQPPPRYAAEVVKSAHVQMARLIGYAGVLNELRAAMAKLKTVEELFKGRHFDRDVVILCVRWYLRFKLSLRDLVEMMAEHGLSMAHTTIMRWVQRYGPEFEKHWQRFARAGGRSWRVDETYVKIRASGATCVVPLIGWEGRSTSG